MTTWKSIEELGVGCRVLPSQHRQGKDRPGHYYEIWTVDETRIMKQHLHPDFKLVVLQHSKTSIP